ncbi:MAG: TetR/AcrR family transcriptional regulator, partial [Gammaproteobacteria bacterium]
MARRNEHSLDEIRMMVLDAAEAIAAEEGLSGLKVRKIAMEIGYTVGSIYMVFENMDDLIMHLKARILEKLEDALKRSVRDESDPGKAVVRLARAYLAFAGREFNSWSLIFEHRPPEDSPPPEWYREKVDRLFSLVEKPFAELKPESGVKERKQAARAVWGGIHGVCILSLTGMFDVVGIDSV